MCVFVCVICSGVRVWCAFDCACVWFGLCQSGCTLCVVQVGVGVSAVRGFVWRMPVWDVGVGCGMWEWDVGVRVGVGVEVGCGSGSGSGMWG